METRSAVVRTGCIWDSKPAAYSDDTKNLLREFMRESKLSFAQQRKLKDTVDKTGMLPPPPAPASKKVRRPAPVPKVLNPKNYGGGLRSHQKISSSGDLSRPTYRPSVSAAPVRTDADKERLAHIMAFGLDSYNDKKSRVYADPPDNFDDLDEDNEVDRFDELVREVEERKQFLAEMSSCGQDKKYRTIIETEISQKLREMEVIDKKRSALLNQHT